MGTGLRPFLNALKRLRHPQAGLAEHRVEQHHCVRFTKSARKEFDGLDDEMLLRVLRHIRTQAAQPRPRGARKLHGGRDEWRIRVGEFRIVYVIDDAAQVVEIRGVGNRKDVYR